MPDGERAARRARELFDSGFYCAESVFLAMAEAHGVSSDLIPRVATGFCSGVARTCGQCGAVSGAILGLSLLTGRSSPEESVERTYVLVGRLIAGFEERFGSTNCRELIGCDLSTEEGQAAFVAGDKLQDCLQYAEEATRIAMTLLEE